ncbi:MAG: hypothetical protein HY556_10700 [Euryarchaeota archaeon]|nr:hypothetical protein [Euryarchaeota archaeon]
MSRSTDASRSRKITRALALFVLLTTSALPFTAFEAEAAHRTVTAVVAKSHVRGPISASTQLDLNFTVDTALIATPETIRFIVPPGFLFVGTRFATGDPCEGPTDDQVDCVPEVFFGGGPHTFVTSQGSEPDGRPFLEFQGAKEASSITLGFSIKKSAATVNNAIVSFEVRSTGASEDHSVGPAQQPMVYVDGTPPTITVFALDPPIATWQVGQDLRYLFAAHDTCPSGFTDGCPLQKFQIELLSGTNLETVHEIQRFDDGEESGAGFFEVPSGVDGTLVLRAKAFDDVALMSTPEVLEAVVDTAAPQLVSISASPNPAKAGNVTISLDFSETIAIGTDETTLAVAGARLPGATRIHSAVWDGSNAYIFGGALPSGRTDAIVRYDPVADETTVMDAVLPSARYGTSAVWAAGKAYIFGGWDGAFKNEILRYDPMEDTITPMVATLPTPRYDMAAVWDGRHVLLFGGHDGTRLDDILMFDPFEDTLVTMGASLPSGRMSASSFWNGSHAFVLGGDDGSTALDEIVRYDPRTDVAMTIASVLPSARHAASIASDGTKAFVFGGVEGAAEVDQIVEYDPGLEKITVLDVELAPGRESAAAVWTGSAALLFGGGAPGGHLSEIVLFRPANGLGPRLTVNGDPASFASHSGASIVFDYRIDDFDEQGSAEIAIDVTDGSGNTGTHVDTTTLVIDTVAPEAALTLSGTLGSGDWFTSCVSPILEAEDPGPSSGITNWSASVDGGAPFYFAGDTTLDSVCSESATHQVVFSARDAAQNTATAARDFKIDRTTPTTTATLTGGVGAHEIYVTAVDVSLSRTSGPSGASTSYALDGGPMTVYSAPFTVTADGSHNLTFQSEAGNGLAEAAQNVNFIIDRSAPNTTVILTGDRLGGRAIYVSDVEVFISFPEDAHANFSIDGADYEDYEGPVTVTGDGSHRFEWYVEDNAGHLAGPLNRTFDIDTSAPSVTDISASAAATTVGPLTITIQSSEALEAAPEVTVNGDSAPFQSGADLNFTFIYHVSALDEQGAASVLVTGTDLAGHPLEHEVGLFTIDTVAPSTFVVTDPEAPDGENGWFVTDVTVGVSCEDETMDCVSTTFETYGPAPTPLTNPFSIATDGSYEVTHRGVDSVGNTGQNRTTTVKQDRAPPELLVLSPTQALISNSTRILLNFTDSDDTSGVASRSCDLSDGQGWIPCTAATDLEFPGDGLQTLSIRVKDSAGNAKVESVDITVDTVPPEIDFRAPFDGDHVNVRSITLLFDDDGTGTHVVSRECSVDGDPFSACISGDTFDFASEGEKRIVVRVADQAANVFEKAVSFTVDTIPPALAELHVEPQISTAGQVTLTFVSDEPVAEPPIVTINGNLAAFEQESNLVFSYTYEVDAEDEQGDAIIEIFAADLAGNPSSLNDASSLTIDTVPATVRIVSPRSGESIGSQNVTLDFRAGGTGSSIVSKTCTTSEDPIDFPCQAGDRIPFASTGAKTITLTVTDEAGNSFADSVSFTIHGPVSRVAVSPASGRVVVPGALSFKAVASDRDGNVVPSARFTWRSNNTDVGVVNQATGAFRALSDGSASVEARETGSGISGRSTVEAITQSAFVSRIEIAPDFAMMPAGADQFIAVTGYDDEGNEVGGVAAKFAAQNPTVGTFSSGGVFKAFKVGTTDVTARIGNAAATARIEVIAGTLAEISVTPSTATLSTGASMQFVSAGHDLNHNPVPLENVSWEVDNVSLGSITPSGGVFTAGSQDGTVFVTASKAGLTTRVPVHVTSLRANASTNTTVAATVSTGKIQETVATQYAIGIAAAETDANITVTTINAATAKAALDETTIRFGAAATNVALTLETREGNLATPPVEVDASNLTDLLAGLLSSEEPGMFFTVRATIDGEEADTVALNALIKEMNADLRVSASYFDERHLDPASVRLAEYSDGELVRSDIRATLLAPLPIDGYYRYSVTLRQFSSFALFGLQPPLRSIAVTGPASVVAGTTEVYELRGANDIGDWAPLSKYTTVFLAPTQAGGYDVCHTEGVVTGCKRVQVVSDVLAKIKITGPEFLPTGTSGRFDLFGFDQFGNSVSLLRSDIYFEAPTDPGTTTFTYSELGLTASILVEIVAGLDSISVTPIGVAVPAGGQLALRANGADAFGNRVPVSPGWKSTCGTVSRDGVFTAPLAVGECVVSAFAGLTVGDARIHVVSSALRRIVLSPEKAEVEVGREVSIVATGLDLFDNEVGLSGAYGLQWTSDCGDIDDSGRFKAPSIVTVCNVVVKQAGIAASIPIRILGAPLARLTLDPAKASMLAGDTLEFHATAFDGFGNVLEAETSFSAIRGTLNGATYVAPFMPGDDIVTVSVGNAKASSKVRILPNSQIATQSIDATRGTFGYYKEAYAARLAHREDYPSSWQKAELSGEAGSDYLESSDGQAYLYGVFRPKPTPVEFDGAVLTSRNVLGALTSVAGGETTHSIGGLALRSIPPSSAHVGLEAVDVSGLRGTATRRDDFADGRLYLETTASSGTATATRTSTILEGTMHVDVRTSLRSGAGDLVTIETVAELPATPGSWLATTDADGTIKAIPIEETDLLTFTLEGRTNRWFAVYDPNSTEVAGLVLSGDVSKATLHLEGRVLILTIDHAGVSEVVAAEYLLAYRVKSSAATRYAGVMELARQDAEEIGVVYLASDRMAAVGWAGSKAQIDVASETGITDWWSGLNGVDDTWTIGVYAGSEQAKKPVRLILPAEIMRSGGLELALDGLRLDSTSVGAAADDTSLIITLPIPHFSLRTVQIKTIVPGVPPLFMWLTLGLGAVVGGESLVLARMVLRSRAARRGAGDEDDAFPSPIGVPQVALAKSNAVARALGSTASPARPASTSVATPLGAANAQATLAAAKSNAVMRALAAGPTKSPPPEAAKGGLVAPSSRSFDVLSRSAKTGTEPVMKSQAALRGMKDAGPPATIVSKADAEREKRAKDQKE